ncbi:PGF-pre-PGF domain-containing protein [Halorubrum sp. Atlit-8R]|uniref:PGF-pre-PGF domain-containing protein n=1 Tax=unclassified Halorubrum TaxID=2642239 RepID=UPI000EF1D65D|nr:MULTISPECIES: PGF-pre-PGF domain-containing protein [unclassified Halorubrum]RLM67541.1 PGF-pre-PGF domain-containing protein [Halorubrum sp. Atlit-9R]RLM77700.1 PGF-pre-PGF domain-containing protein [Halorubrum sp. Atlit-8R]
MNLRHLLGIAALAVLVAGLVASGAAVSGAAAQDSPPPTPAAYYGQVTADGEPLDGVTVEAVVDGEVRDSIETDAEGRFGGPGAFDEKLTVEGPADEVTFRVADSQAGTAAWESGANEAVDLSLAEAPAPPDDGDGGDGTPTDPGDGGDDTPTDPGDGDDGGDGTAPGSGTGGAPGGGTGGAPAGGTGGAPGGDDGETPGEGPADPPAVDDVLDLPADASTTGAEAATAAVDEATGTSSVTFTGQTSVEGITFDGAVEGAVGVAEYESAPETTGPAPGASVSVVEISVPASATDTPATIRTRISADRVAAAEADPGDLRLSRFADGEWQGLETTLVEETDDAVVLEAQTPGFSTFAVSAVSEPDAAITVPVETLDPGETVTLSGLQSSDEYGEVVAYDWSIDGDAATGSTTEASFAEPGEYEVTLTVTNDAGETDTVTETVTVAADDAPVEEPGLFSLPTLGAVALAVVVALLVVAAVRRADG